MKKLTTGIFPSREKAEEVINALRNDVHIPVEDISYVYRNINNAVEEVSVKDASSETPMEGAATGALTGGTVGAIAGIATAVGLIPVIGPIFAAGTLLSAMGMGLGAGAVAATVSAAATGAAAGGLIGALMNLGVSDARAKEYEERVAAGDILVAVNSENTIDVENTLKNHGAMFVETYTPKI